jgi:hypothetical protein
MPSGVVDRGVAKHVERVPLAEAAFQLDKREEAECCVYDTTWVDEVSDWPLRAPSKRERRRAEIAGEPESDGEGQPDASGGEGDDPPPLHRAVGPARVPRLPIAAGRVPAQHRAAPAPPIDDGEAERNALCVHKMPNRGFFCADIAAFQTLIAIKPLRELADACLERIGAADLRPWERRLAKMARLFAAMRVGPVTLERADIEELDIRGPNPLYKWTQQDLCDVVLALVDGGHDRPTCLGSVFESVATFVEGAGLATHRLPVLRVQVTDAPMTLLDGFRQIAAAMTLGTLADILFVQVDRRYQDPITGVAATSREAFTLPSLYLHRGDSDHDRFEVFAVIAHLGTVEDGGHYVAAERISGRWVICDCAEIRRSISEAEFMQGLSCWAESIVGVFLVRESLADALIQR